jgi:hypothetical protein
MVRIELTEECYDSPPMPYIIRNLLETYLEVAEWDASIYGVPEFELLMIYMAGEAEFEFCHDVAMEAYETELPSLKGCETLDEFIELLEQGELDGDLNLDREDFSESTVREISLNYLKNHNIFYCVEGPPMSITYVNYPIIGVW